MDYLQSTKLHELDLLSALLHKKDIKDQSRSYPDKRPHQFPPFFLSQYRLNSCSGFLFLFAFISRLTFALIMSIDCIINFLKY